jgi:sugar lactone lactonase YvrE
MKTLLLFLALILIIAATTLWVRHGGGEPYPDLTQPPELAADELRVVLSYSEPIGNVAVNRDGRTFFTVHPESRPRGNKLLEYVNGASIPFPSVQQQKELFDTPLGLVVDRFNRLWILDHGNHGVRTARIVGIDLSNGEILRDQKLDANIAPMGSLLQDLQVSTDGNTIIIADASFWRMKPALIVYDIETGNARRVLESHDSVSAEDYVIHSQGRYMNFLGGMVVLRGGVDGIALGPEWLYYGARNGSGLFRIKLKDLRNPDLPQSQMANRVERYSDKPLSDGFSLDSDGNVYITDVEHNAIFRIGADRKLVTLIQSKEIRWPDALSFGPNGALYVADSALPELILKSADHIEAHAPYRIFRFPTGHSNAPGQ